MAHYELFLEKEGANSREESREKSKVGIRKRKRYTNGFVCG
jgi:hypothetical protein